MREKIKPPTPEALRAVLQEHGLSTRQAAELMMLSDDRQVRKYLNGERRIDPARWFVLHARLVLQDDALDAIVESMNGG